MGEQSAPSICGLDASDDGVDGGNIGFGAICSQEALTNIFMAAEFIVGCAVIPVYQNEYRLGTPTES